jgi:hypothetical protein
VEFFGRTSCFVLPAHLEDPGQSEDDWRFPHHHVRSSHWDGGPAERVAPDHIDWDRRFFRRDRSWMAAYTARRKPRQAGVDVFSQLQSYNLRVTVRRTTECTGSRSIWYALIFAPLTARIRWGKCSRFVKTILRRNKLRSASLIWTSSTSIYLRVGSSERASEWKRHRRGNQIGGPQIHDQ